MREPKVSFIVVNWNGMAHVFECLESIERQSYPDFEILVVDNSSTDGSVEELQNRKSIRLIRNDTNLGFGKANNQAIGLAKGEMVAFVNNDIVLDPDWLRCMLVPLEKNGEVGSVAGKTLFFDDRGRIDNTGHLLYWDGVNRGRGRMQEDHGQYDGTSDALFPSGAACIFRRKALEQIGFFDEDFFLYGDDTELGLRARLAGWECAFAFQAVAYHRYSASTSAYDPLKYYYVERNRLWVVWKYFPWELVLLNPFFSFARYTFHAAALLSRKGVSGEFARRESSWKLVAIWGKAQISAWQRFFPFLRKRRDLVRKLGWTRKQFYRCFLKHRLGLRELTFTP